MPVEISSNPLTLDAELRIDRTCLTFEAEAVSAKQAETDARLLAQQRERQSLVVSAHATLDGALGLCERGETGRGLLQLAHGLGVAEHAGDRELADAYRWNLGAWSQQLHTLGQTYVLLTKRPKANRRYAPIRRRFFIGLHLSGQSESSSVQSSSILALLASSGANSLSECGPAIRIPS